MSRKNAQKSIKERLNEYQQGRRQIRMQSRRTVAAQLIGQSNMLIASFNGFTNMRLYQKLAWFLFGPRYINYRGYGLLVAIVLLVAAIGFRFYMLGGVR